MISWNNYLNTVGAADNLTAYIGLSTLDNGPLILPMLGGLGGTPQTIQPDGFSLAAHFEVTGRYPIACVGILGVNSLGARAFDVKADVEFDGAPMSSARYEQWIDRLSDIIVPLPFDESADYYPTQALSADLIVKSESGSPISVTQLWVSPGVQCAARFTMNRGAGSQAQLDRGHSGALYSAGVVSWREYDVELVCRTVEQWYRPGGLQDLQALGIGAEVVILPTGGASGTPHAVGAPVGTKRGRESLALHGRISSPLIANQIAAAENYTRVTFRVEECL